MKSHPHSTLQPSHFFIPFNDYQKRLDLSNSSHIKWKRQNYSTFLLLILFRGQLGLDFPKPQKISTYSLLWTIQSQNDFQIIWRFAHAQLFTPMLEIQRSKRVHDDQQYFGPTLLPNRTFSKLHLEFLWSFFLFLFGAFLTSVA